MRDWKVHLVWALAAGLLAIGAVRWAVNRNEQLHSLERDRLHERIKQMERKVSSLEGGLGSPSEVAPTTPGISGSEAAPGRRLGEPGEDSAARNHARANEREEALAREKEKILGMRSLGPAFELLARVMEASDPKEKLKLARQLVEMKGADALAVSYALQELGRGGDPEAVELARGIYKSEKEDWLRAIALETMATLGKESAIPLLEDALRQPEMRLRTRAARALRALGHPEFVTPMVQEISLRLRDPDGGTRNEAVELLGELGSAEALPHLAVALTDSNSDVRKSVVRSLCQIESESVIPVLEQAEKDTNPKISEAARRALERVRENLRR